METPIYARDMKKEILTDIFMGKGFEKLLEQAEIEDKELIVGYFKEKPNGGRMYQLE